MNVYRLGDQAVFVLNSMGVLLFQNFLYSKIPRMFFDNKLVGVEVEGRE